MTVRVGVQTDATATLQAMRQLREEMDKLGQAGKALNDIDLNLPDLQPFAQEIQQIIKNVEDLRRVGRGETGAFFRKAGAGPVTAADPAALLHALNLAYPGGIAQQANVTANIGRTVFQGTRWGPPGTTQGPVTPMPPTAPPPQAGQPAPASPPPPRPAWHVPGNTPPGGGNNPPPDPMAAMASRGLSALKAGGLFALGQAGFTSIANLAGTAIGTANDEAIANNHLYRSAGDAGASFDFLRDQVRDAAEGLGVTFEEAQRLTRSFTELSGAADGARAAGAVSFAAGVGRGIGVDGATMVHTAGRVGFLGEDPREFAVLMATVMRDANMTGRGGEVGDTLARWTETANRMLATQSGMAAFGDLYAHLSKNGPPGLRGQGAANLLQDINSALAQGGAAGDASQFLTARALQRRGISDPFEAQMLTEGGMFEDAGGTSFLNATMDEFNRLYAGASESRRAHALGRHLGISGRHARAFMRASATYGGRSVDEAAAQLKQAGIDMSGMDPSAIGDVVQAASADGETLRRMRDQALTRKRGDGTNGTISDEDARRLGGASGDDLRKILIEVLGRSGMERNQGVRTAESIANFTNQLTRTGSTLTDGINLLRDGLSTLTGGVADLAEELRDWFDSNYGTEEQKAAAQQRRTARAARTEVAGSTGGDGTSEGNFLDQMTAGLEGTGQNPRSSANGYGQFINSTLLRTLRRDFADRTVGGIRAGDLTDAQIRNPTPDMLRDMGTMRADQGFMRDVAKAHLRNDIDPSVRAGGFAEGGEPSSVARYAGWHFGPSMISKIMRADPGRLMSDVVGPEATAANPHLARMTVGQWIARTRGAFSEERRRRAPSTVVQPGISPGPTMDDMGGTVPGRTVIPDSPRGPGDALPGAQEQAFAIQPLQVYVRDGQGRVMREELLPVAPVGQPRAYGSIG